MKCIGMARVVYIIRKLEIQFQNESSRRIEFEDLYWKYDFGRTFEKKKTLVGLEPIWCSVVKKVGSGVSTKFRAVADVADVEHVPLSILDERLLF